MKLRAAGGSGSIRRWAPAAVGAALAVNALLFWLVSALSTEQALPPDLVGPVPVRMVRLEREEAPPPPEKPPEERPEPPPQMDFTPDLRPAPPTSRPQLDHALRVDLGALPRAGVGERFVFDESDLDSPPQPVSTLAPVYPYRARHRNVEGWVRLKFLVREDGSVGDVQVLEAQPPGLFEESVLRTVPQWRYRPGRIGGKAVASWVIKVVRFDLDG